MIPGNRGGFAAEWSQAALEDLHLPAPVLLATIWATVDVDRTASRLGLECEDLRRDPHLGARVCLVRPQGDPAVALVEPVTEGRLAGILARHDEGPAGAYVTWDAAFDAVLATFRAAGAVLSAIAAGPFGRSALVLAGPGANNVIVESPAATIER